MSTNQKYYCEICEDYKNITINNSYIGSHVKRIHKIKLYDYIKRYYKNIGLIKFKKCSFCDNEAIPEYTIDHIEKTYSISYKFGYICKTEECKKHIFKNFYPTKKYTPIAYSKIGSNTEYLAIKYKISISDAKKMKYGEIDQSKPYRTNLEDYVKRYGAELGLSLYKKRCEKISKSNTKKYYIETYGEELGTKKWNSYINKIKKATLGNSVSKASKQIMTLLSELNIKYIDEYLVNPNRYNKRVDYFLPDYNLIIEFFGDYWHSNPLKVNGNDLHKTKKIKNCDIWENDEKRLSNFLLDINDVKILIIWESCQLDTNKLKRIIDNIKPREIKHEY